MKKAINKNFDYAPLILTVVYLLIAATGLTCIMISSKEESVCRSKDGVYVSSRGGGSCLDPKALR